MDPFYFIVLPILLIALSLVVRPGITASKPRAVLTYLIAILVPIGSAYLLLRFLGTEALVGTLLLLAFPAALSLSVGFIPFVARRPVLLALLVPAVFFTGVVLGMSTGVSLGVLVP